MRALYLTILFIVTAFLTYWLFCLGVSLVFRVAYLDIATHPCTVIFIGLCSLVVGGVIANEEYERLY